MSFILAASLALPFGALPASAAEAQDDQGAQLPNAVQDDQGAQLPDAAIAADRGASSQPANSSESVLPAHDSGSAASTGDSDVAASTGDADPAATQPADSSQAGQPQGLSTGALGLASANSSSGLAPQSAGRVSALSLRWTGDTVQGRYEVSGSHLDLTPEGSGEYQYGKPGSTAHAELAFKVEAGSPIAAGDVQVRIPSSVFRDRDGNAVGGMEGIGIPSRDEFAGSTAEDALCYYEDNAGTPNDASDDSIVITNGVPLSDAYDYTVTLTYGSGGPYSDPGDIKGGEGDRGFENDAITARAVVLDGSGAETERLSSAPLSLRWHTNAVFDELKVGGTGSYAPSPFAAWNESWGVDKPSDADESFFVVWPVNASVRYDSMQHVRFSYDFSSDGGRVVAWGQHRAMQGDYVFEPGGAHFAESDYSLGGDSRYVIAQYPKSMLEEGRVQLSAQVSATMEGIDGAAGLKDASFSFVYETKPFEYPAQSYKAGKKGASLTVSGAADAIEHAQEGALHVTAPARFDVGAWAQGGALTLAEGGDASDPADYGKRAYDIELSDDLVTLSGERLVDGDYAMTRLYVSDRKIDAYPDDIAARADYDYAMQADGNWGESPVYEGYATQTLEYRTSTSGAWIPLGTVDYDFNGSTYTPAGGAPSHLGLEGIELPEGTVGVRASEPSTHLRSEFTFGVDVTLNATAHVKGLVAKEETPILENVGSLVVTGPDGQWVDKATAEGLSEAEIARDEAEFGGAGYAQHASDSSKLGRFSSWSFISKGVTGDYGFYEPAIVNDELNKQVVIGYYATASQTSDVPAGSTPESLRADGSFDEQKTGDFYDLLPAGMAIDEGSVKAWATAGAPSTNNADQHWSAEDSLDAYRVDASVETVPNWRGSGRTMAIVHVSAPESLSLLVTPVSSGTYAQATSGFHVEFDAVYPWDALADYGASVRNLMAYRSGSALSGGSPDSGSQYFSADENALMSDLDDDGNPEGTPDAVGYDSDDQTITAETSTSLATNVMAKGEDETAWMTDAFARQGGEYSYRLRTAAEENASVKAPVFYDSIERAGGWTPGDVESNAAAGRWNGALESVDVAQLRLAGVDPVVYYSTKEGLALDSSADAADRDLADDSVWSTTPPEDMADVTAVAVDCSRAAGGGEFTLAPKHALSVVLNMRAPADYDAVRAYEKAGAAAENAWTLSSTRKSAAGAWESGLLDTDAARVAIVADAAQAGISKTVEGAQVASGGAGDGLSFDVSADVPDFPQGANTRRYEISDSLPNGLAIDASTLRVDGIAGDSSAELPAAAYELRWDEADGRTAGFTLSFDYDSISGYDAVRVSYDAAIAADAPVGPEGMPNEATLTYSKAPYDGASFDVKSAEAKAYTYGLVVQKVDAESGEALAGASFTLSKAEGGEPLSFVAADGGYRAADGDAGASTELEVGSEGADKGMLEISGLAEGEYLLAETSAPAGYEPLAAPVSVSVADSDAAGALDGNVEGQSEDAPGYARVEVGNEKAAPGGENGQGASQPQGGSPESGGSGQFSKTADAAAPLLAAAALAAACAGAAIAHAARMRSRAKRPSR